MEGVTDLSTPAHSKDNKEPHICSTIPLKRPLENVYLKNVHGQIIHCVILDTASYHSAGYIFILILIFL
jgi:hypothetical protein